MPLSQNRWLHPHPHFESLSCPRTWGYDQTWKHIHLTQRDMNGCVTSSDIRSCILASSCERKWTQTGRGETHAKLPQSWFWWRYFQAKTKQWSVHHRSSRQRITVYCTSRWAGLGQQDHNNMLIVHHCRDIISRITLWWNWSQPLWAIQSDVGDFETPLLFHTPEFHVYCPPLCCLHMKLDAAVGKAGLPTAASPTEMGKDASTQTQSSPPSAAADEWGCCRQVSCEFETAAERTHCALTTQSGSDAAQLPGTTSSIWHTHAHTHACMMRDRRPNSGLTFKCSVREKPYHFEIILQLKKKISLHLRQWTIHTVNSFWTCPSMVCGWAAKSPVASLLFSFCGWKNWPTLLVSRLYVLERPASVLWENVCLNKRGGYQAGTDTKHTKQSPNKHPGGPAFSSSREVPGGESCLWKEHLHAVRVSETATKNLAPNNTFFLFFFCFFNLMFAYLQFVTWLVYFTSCWFGTHLCPDGLISSGLIFGKKLAG